MIIHSMFVSLQINRYLFSIAASLKTKTHKFKNKSHIHCVLRIIVQLSYIHLIYKNSLHIYFVHKDTREQYIKCLTEIQIQCLYTLINLIKFILSKQGGIFWLLLSFLGVNELSNYVSWNFSGNWWNISQHLNLVYVFWFYIGIRKIWSHVISYHFAQSWRLSRHCLYQCCNYMRTMKYLRKPKDISPLERK